MAAMPTLDVQVLRRWVGGALEPGEKARLPADLARRLEKVGAVRILQAAPVEKALPVATPEDHMAVAERAPIAVAEPVPPRRRRR